MMCFRDMTFCPFNADCAKAAQCHRALTEQVRAAAEDWWGGEDAPIAQFMTKPGCHEPVETQT